MSKLTIIICVLVALAYFANAEEIEPESFADAVAAEDKAEGSPDEKSPEPSEAEGEEPEDSVLMEGEVPLLDAAPNDTTPEDISDPFGIFEIIPDDIMDIRMHPSTGTVFSDFSSSKSSSSSKKMVNGVLVEDKKNEQTIVNDGQTVTVTNSTSS